MLNYLVNWFERANTLHHKSLYSNMANIVHIFHKGMDTVVKFEDIGFYYTDIED